MRKIKFKMVSTLVVCFTLLLIISPIKGSSSETEKIEIALSYGLEGKYKKEVSIPLEVEIKNVSKEALKGEIEVLVPNAKGTKDLYIQGVEVLPETTRKFYIPTNGGKDNSKINVKVKENGVVLQEKEVKTSSDKLMNYGELIMGVLSDDIKSLEYFSNFKIEGKNSTIYMNGTKITPISNEILHSNPKNLKIMDMILINNYDSSKLTEEMLINLDGWVKSGGVLILGGTENTINNLNKSFLNANLSTKKSKWVNFKDGGATLNLGNLTGDVGDVKVKDKKTVVSTRVPRGNGAIVLSTFDLGSKSFYEFPGVNLVIENILKDDLTKKFGPNAFYSGYPYNIDESLNTIPLKNTTDFSNLLMMFGAFALVVSFGSYFLLRKIDKRELMWIAIPVLSLAFTFVMVKIGEETSVKDVILSGINIVKVDEEGKGKVESFVSIGNNYKSNLNITEKEGESIEELINDMQSVNPGTAGGATDKIGVTTTFNGNSTNYEYKDLGALELRKFKIKGKEIQGKKITSNLNYSGNGLNGTIVNSDSKVKKGILVFGNNIWDLGDIEPGETIQFNNRNADFANGLERYLMKDDKYYYENIISNSSVSEEDKEKFKDYFRVLSIIRQSSSVGEVKDPYLISITEDELEYGISLGTDNISKFSNTAYVTKVNIDLKDEAGNTVYPLGYLDKEIESSTDEVGLVGGSGGIIWGSGHVVLKYQLPEKYVPSEMILAYISSDEEKPFKGKVEIYNYKTEKFEEIIVAKDAPLTLNNLKNYVNEGEFKFKISCEGEEGSLIPEVSTKGRFK